MAQVQSLKAHSHVGHSDRPLDHLEQDSLGLRIYAEGLAEFIRNCDTPFTVAVQGDWGTGKTSLMRMVGGLLTPTPALPNTPHIQTVWFQTWQYSQFGSTAALPVSLLATLLQCLSGEPGKLQQATQVMGRLMKPLASAAIRASTLGMSEWEDFEDLAAKKAVDSATDAERLKKEIGKLVEGRLGSGVDRIVVFVDDLDRIKPAIAVEILETIKLFVDWPGCVFVLALDYRVVSRGVPERLGIAERDFGRSFFDKIIQLPFTVPVAQYTVDQYIDGLFRDMRLPMGKEDGRLFADLVRWSVSVNPRGIKRVFNSLQLLITMARAQKNRLQIRILFAVLCLQIGYEEVYNWLLDKASQLTVADLLAFASADEGSRDNDLAAVVSAIPEIRRDDFSKFVTAFLTSIQDPAHRDREIDAQELARIRETLTLSRVTSVQAAAPSVTDVADAYESRRRNKQLIGKLRHDLESILAKEIQETKNPFWVNTGQQTSTVWLKRNVISGGSLNLVVAHDETETLLYVQGGKHALERNSRRLRQVLEPVADFYEEGDEGPLFYRRVIPAETPDADREALLLGEVKDRYLQAHGALKAQLWQ